jgi:hypothetical protein
MSKVTASSSRTTCGPGRLVIGPASFGCSWLHELVVVRGRCCTSVLCGYGCGSSVGRLATVSRAYVTQCPAGSYLGFHRPRPPRHPRSSRVYPALGGVQRSEGFQPRSSAPSGARKPVVTGGHRLAGEDVT